jgi:hypothetical protein
LKNLVSHSHESVLPQFSAGHGRAAQQRAPGDQQQRRFACCCGRLSPAVSPQTSRLLMRTLVIPPAAQRDENAIQMLSAWIAENGLHCTMNVGVWSADGHDEPASWGILLADVIRHVANAIESKHGAEAASSVERIVESLLAEIDNPSSEVKGDFQPGHS